MAFGRLKVDELVTSTQTVSVDTLVGIAADGDKGDITVSGSGTVWSIDDGAVDTAALGGDITAAGKALLDDADAAAQRTTLGAEAAGTAASAISTHEAAADPHPGYALESSLATVATTGAYGDLTGTPTLVANLDDLGDVDLTTTPPADGEALVYDSATGDWVPGAAGATAAGSANEIQYNDGASGLAASADLTWDNTAKELGVGGNIKLDDGGTYATTLQLITPTANRTISFPDATGTVGLVGGSSGQLIYNNAGAYAGAPSTSVGASGDITLSLNGAADTPPLKLTGTWFSGGTSTTTKPQFLIEPTGTTSTAWSTSGTGLGVNAPSGFSGNLLDLQVDGVSKIKISGEVISNSLYDYAKDGIFRKVGGGPFTIEGFSFRSDKLHFTGPLNGIIGFSNDSGHYAGNVSAGARVAIQYDGNGTIAQRDGSYSQAYRLYNTHTDASNYERAKLSWNNNVFEIGTEGAGTGSEQPVRITAATLKLPNLPTYADNAAATSGGLVAGDVYKTATGELRITV